MTPEASHWEDVLGRASIESRAAVLGLGEGGKKVVGKGASGDTTLLADKAAEEAVMKALGGESGVRFLGEEAGKVGEPSAPFLAVIDPLDGSSNYLRGVPFYCTSIAVAHGRRLSDVLAGHILDLVTGDEYFASKGGGAKKNGMAIRTSEILSLENSTAGLDLSGMQGPRLGNAMEVVKSTRRQLHLGANALELSMLAAGNIDCFVDLREKMRVTDVAAALLILKEAGGVYSRPDGSLLDPELNLKERISVVASGNPELHARLVALLSEP